MITNKKPYIIGETAFHHEGDKFFLKELIIHAQNLGLNAIKFHFTVDIDNYMVANHEAINILRPWCLNETDWDEVLTDVKIDIIGLCNDVKSVEYAIKSKFNIAAIEIHATGLNDIFLLDKASQFDKTIILGTGGSTLDEIEFAINFLKNRGKHDILLMHGFQNYPTDFRDIKLDRMNKLANLFNLPIGYADHTDPLNPYNEYITCLGIANGHNIIEKHFTHHFGEKRIDSQAAISIEQMEKVKEIADITFNTISQNNSLRLTPAELKYGNTGPMKKAIVAKNEIKKGDLISLKNIAFKRTNNSSSIKQLELDKILNNKANRNIEKDEIIDLSNVNYEFATADISQFKNTSK